MGVPGIGNSAFAAQLTCARGDMVIADQLCEWSQPSDDVKPSIPPK
jgi:hypothetical protein